MKNISATAVLVGAISACAGTAENTGPVEPLIEACMGEGFSHQVCACTSINLRAEIGDQDYSELLRVIRRMAVLKAQGFAVWEDDPRAGLGEYQYLLTERGMLTQRTNSPGLAYVASRDLCNAQVSN